jgi:hypothetical protein
MKPNWKKRLRGLYSAVIFAVLASVVFRSWELAWMVTLGLGFHELGHVLLVWWFGIDWEVGFGVFGAWTRTPLKARLALGHYSNSLIHLAGPLFSLLLALLALVGHLLSPQNPAQDFWLRMANFNALLGLLNVLPFGALSDGGKFVRKLFSSLDESTEKKFLWALALWSLSLAWLFFVIDRDLVRLISVSFIGVWFIVHMLLESRLDDPAEAASPKAMTDLQAALLLFVMVGILLVATAVVMQTPLWLTRERVLNMFWR